MGASLRLNAMAGVATLALLLGPSAAMGHRLDAATASVLAEDIDGVQLADDLVNEVVRCYRVTIHRVDCIVVSGFDVDETAWVRSVALRGQRLHFGQYRARLRNRGNYTKENTIRESPPGFRLEPIWREYRSPYANAVYQPRRLLRRNLGLGYGKPKRRAIIRKQCRLQRRLPCPNRR